MIYLVKKAFLKFTLLWLALSLIALPLQAANIGNISESTSAPYDIKVMMDVDCENCVQEGQCCGAKSDCSVSQSTPASSLLPTDFGIVILSQTTNLLLMRNEINTAHVLSSIYRPPRA